MMANNIMFVCCAFFVCLNGTEQNSVLFDVCWNIAGLKSHSCLPVMRFPFLPWYRLFLHTKKENFIPAPASGSSMLYDDGPLPLSNLINLVLIKQIFITNFVHRMLQLQQPFFRNNPGTMVSQANQSPASGQLSEFPIKRREFIRLDKHKSGMLA